MFTNSEFLSNKNKMSRCGEPKKKRVKLSSPTGGKPIWFPISFEINSDSDSDNDDIDDLIKTIRFIGEDNTALPVEEIILPRKEFKNFENVFNVCDKYNRCMGTIRYLEKGTSLCQTRFDKYPSRELYNFIIQQCYRRAVKNPSKLNKYDPFSPEVYGETSFELICLIIDSLQITEDDVFLDLGSGIGQVVLQMAALTSCKLCVGIEKNNIPSLYAENLAAYFREWMHFFGKKYNKIDLIQNDFLNDESMEHIRNATIIFVNNVSFGPQINHQLTLKFQDLNDGVRIISPVTFCPEKFRITGRSLNNIASIMSIVEIPHLKGPVSWTSKSIAYYIHILDRRKLENFFIESVKKERGLDSTMKETDQKRWKKIYDSEPTGFKTVFSSDQDEGNCSQTSWSISDVDTKDIEISTDNKKHNYFHGDSNTEHQLNDLLENFGNQYMDMIQQMKQNSYKDYITNLIEVERKKKIHLKQNVNKLVNEINMLENNILNVNPRQ